MRLPRWTWLAVMLAFAVGITLGLSFQLGLELRGESSPPLRSALGAARGLLHLQSNVAAAKPTALGAVPVYVVEEHHEALPYWRAAADAVGTRKVGHSLVHFDAHPDMAVPRAAQGEQLGLAANDEFIVAAAMQGLVDRFIWIWPSWDRRGRRHKRHSNVLITWSTVGYMDGDEPCICETRYDIKDTAYLADPLGWHKFRSHHVVGESSQTKCESGGDNKFQDETMCVEVGFLMQVYVNEQTLQSTSAWWPTLLSGPLILDIDEDHFGQKASNSLLMNIKKELHPFLSELSCLQSFEEGHANHLIRQLVAAQLVRPVPLVDGPVDPLEPPKELADHCPADSLRRLGKALGKLYPNELELLLLYGFCFDTSPRTLVRSSDKRYVRVCDAGAEQVATDTDRSFAEEALSMEPVAMSRRLDFFASSLRALLPWVETAELVTICRSVRDGYTPNRVWFQIESSLLALLGPNVTFDEHLVGGPHGWEAWTQEAQTMFMQINTPADMHNSQR